MFELIVSTVITFAGVGAVVLSRRSSPGLRAAMLPAQERFGLDVSANTYPSPTLSGEVDGFQVTVGHDIIHRAPTTRVLVEVAAAGVPVIKRASIGATLHPRSVTTGDETFDRLHAVRSSNRPDALARMGERLRAAVDGDRKLFVHPSGTLELHKPGWTKDPDAIVAMVQAAVEAAADLARRDQTICERLVMMALTDPLHAVRLRAVEALGEMHPLDVKPFIPQLLDAKQPAVRLAAARVAPKLPLQTVVGMMMDEALPWAVRRGAIELLADRAEPEQLEAMLPELDALFDRASGAPLVAVLGLLRQMNRVPSVDRIGRRFWAVGADAAIPLMDAAATHGEAAQTFLAVARERLTGGGLAFDTPTFDSRDGGLSVEAAVRTSEAEA